MKFDLISMSRNVSQMSQFPVLYSNCSTASCCTDWVYRTTTWRCCHRASQTSSISGSSTSARTVRKAANSSPLSFSFLESSYAIGRPITEAEAHWYLCLGEWDSWERAPDSVETIYIWTVHTYRLYRRQCANKTHTYTQYTQCTIRHTYSYQYTLYTVCTHSTLCTHIYTQ